MNKPLSKSEAERRLAQLRAAIDQYRYEYHVLDRQSISDAALDSLKRELTQLEERHPELITPDSPSQRIGGAPLLGFTKVPHSQRMNSLADVFSVDELRAWDERWRKLQPQGRTGYLIDLKLDGLAVNLRYDRGLFVQAATRGDGLVGEDVTRNVKTIEAVPLRLRTASLSATHRRALTGIVEVRGEIVMLKKDFAALNRRQEKLGQLVFANPRNVAAGSIRQLDPSIAASRKLSFYAWELVSDLGQRTLSDAYDLLRRLGLPVNPRATTGASLDDIIRFHQQVFADRDRLPFWIDGIVVKVDDRRLYRDLGIVGKTPRAAVAWKFAAEQVTTVVEDIAVQVGRTGALTPVAHLRPVEVAGTTVARATLHNADEVARLNVRVGDTVVIQKAGDVIPDVVQVIMNLRPKTAPPWRMPIHCPVCRSAVHRRTGEVVAYCSNPKCPARERESLYHFVSKKAFDITGLGPSTVDVLIEEGLVKEPADFFHLQSDDLVGLPLFAEIKSEKLTAAVDSARRVRLDRFIYALGIRHVGEQTAIDLARYFGSIKQLMAAAALSIARVPNVGSVVAESIQAWFELTRNRKLVARLMREVRIMPMESLRHTPLFGKTVVITGSLATMSREEAEEAVRRAGGKTSGSVSAKTAYVVVGSEPGSKATKAKKLKVPTLAETEFKKLLG